MIRKYFWAVKARHLYIFIAVLGLFFINFISACNNSSGNNSAETGTVSFRIEWPADAGDNIEASQWIVKDYGSETSETLVSATPVTLSDDCQSRGIVTVAVNVTDALETFSVSEQFACDQGVGKINISAGTGRHFIVSGLGGDGTERYHGEKQDITIHAGSNDIGVIQMERNSEFCTDADGDGYYAERDCGTAIDCNDRNADIYPGAMEICGDGRDQDCDGKDTACQPVPADVDDDGDGYSENQGDCNDRNANIFPGAVEICDSLDNDCDGSVDEGNVCQTCTDADKDGYYKENGCGGTQDCNDNDANINPDAVEICNDSKDNDCDGLIDCDDPDCDAVCNPCTDADGDGFFAEANCGTIVDCNDNDASIHPGASEICDDGIDQNCDGEADEGCIIDNSQLVGRWVQILKNGQPLASDDSVGTLTIYEGGESTYREDDYADGFWCYYEETYIATENTITFTTKTSDGNHAGCFDDDDETGTLNYTINGDRLTLSTTGFTMTFQKYNLQTSLTGYWELWATTDYASRPEEVGVDDEPDYWYFEQSGSTFTGKFLCPDDNFFSGTIDGDNFSFSFDDDVFVNGTISGNTVNGTWEEVAFEKGDYEAGGRFWGEKLSSAPVCP